ncbi:MAG: DNA polymerase III subunit chi [Pseudomonadota bacterium]|nr:DNA polymerase III subunit chi [Pseudomonadota bacterium]
MTRVDFHSNIADKIGYTCRLVRKARAADAQVVVWADAAQLAALDAALWSFSEFDFIAHVGADDQLAARTPVLLAIAQDAPQSLPHHQILINLTAQPPVHFARFERLFEIVTPTPDEVASGRERYRYYQQRGYPLTHTVADKS